MNMQLQTEINNSEVQKMVLWEEWESNIVSSYQQTLSEELLIEQRFKESLRDVVAILKKKGPTKEGVDQIINSVKDLGLFFP